MPAPGGRRIVPALLAACFVLLTLASAAHGARMQIEATHFTVDRERETFTYEDSRVRIEGMTLFTSRMVLDAKAGVARATGFIRLETPTLFGTAEEMELNTKNGEFVLKRARLYDARSGLFLQGDEVAVRPDGTMRIRGCEITTCSQDVVAPWSITTSSLDVRPNALASAWNPTLYVGVVPVFWMPFIAWPTVRERRSGVLPPLFSREQSSLERLDLGYRLKIPVFLNLGVEQDLTIYPEYIQNRGNALGLEYNYALTRSMTGTISTFGLKEKDPRDPAEENDILPAGEAARRNPRPLRYMLDWEHNQELWEDSRLVLSFHHSSDGQVRREYQRVTQYRPWRTYQASLTGQGGWLDWGLTMEQNADYLNESIYADEAGSTDRNQRPRLLPRLTARTGGRIFPSIPLVLELGVSATRFEAREDVSGVLMVASPGVQAPLGLGGAFELTLAARRDFVSYGDMTQYTAGAGTASIDDAHYTQDTYEVELRTAFARIFHRDEGPIASLKHRIIPRVIYREVEDVPQPFSDRILRARPALRMGVLRLDNILFSKRRMAPSEGAKSDPDSELPGLEDGTVSELLRMNLIQRYNFLREPGVEEPTNPGFDREQETLPGEPRLPLILEAWANGPEYSIFSTLHYHHQRERITRAQLVWSGNAGTHSKLNIGYDFNEFTHLTPDNKVVPETNAFTFGGEMELSARSSLGFQGRFNLQDSTPPLERRIDRSLVFLEYHPPCYTVRITFEEELGSAEENNTETYFINRGVTLTFNLTGLVGGRRRSGQRNGPATEPGLEGRRADGGAQPLASARRPARCSS